MTDSTFNEEEIKQLETIVAAQETWTDWNRRKSFDGRDVIEISVSVPQPHAIRLTKAGDPASYMAAGMKGWSLVVCSTFDELIATITGIPGDNRLAG